MTDKVKPKQKARPKQKVNPKQGDGDEKRIVKGLGFVGIAADANAVEVDVKNGKIIRINPLHYDRKYQPEEFNPWKIEARGKAFEPSMKSLIPPLSLGYKNRVYSPNRILYPLLVATMCGDASLHSAHGVCSSGVSA